MSILFGRRRFRGAGAELTGMILRTRRVRAIYLIISASFCPQAANAGGSPSTDKEKAVSVWVKVDGTKRPLTTSSNTVGAMLAETPITVNPLDRISPAKNTPLKCGMVVSIVRVSALTTERNGRLPFNTSYQFSKNLRPGAQRVIQEGREGVGVQVLRVWMKDGQVTQRKVVATRVQKKPLDRIIMMGERSLALSRGGMRPRKILWLEATGYSPDPRSCGKHATGYTSIGLRAGYGVVAVDPRVIPLGTRLFIEGYGYAVAADVGGAIKGMRIDLGHDTHSRALQVGRRAVKVYVLD